MIDKVIIKYKGQKVYCYGKVRDDSNFEVVCDDEWHDGIYANGNPESDDYTFKNWTEVVHFLIDNYRPDIEQLTAC